jgi:hypothetical protein
MVLPNSRFRPGQEEFSVEILFRNSSSRRDCVDCRR